MAKNESAATSATTESTTAQGRFVVSLPKEVGEQIDAIGTRISDELRASTGVHFELTRAQIVQSLIRQAITESDAQASEVAQEAEKVAGAV